MCFLRVPQRLGPWTGRRVASPDEVSTQPCSVIPGSNKCRWQIPSHGVSTGVGGCGCGGQRSAGRPLPGSCRTLSSKRRRVGRWRWRYHRKAGTSAAPVDTQSWFEPPFHHRLQVEIQQFSNGNLWLTSPGLRPASIYKDYTHPPSNMQTSGATSQRWCCRNLLVNKRGSK